METDRVWVIMERISLEDIAHHTLCTALQKAALRSLSHKEAVEFPSHKLFCAGKKLWQIISLQLLCSYILP